LASVSRHRAGVRARRRRRRRTHCANPGDYWIAQILFWISG